MRGCRYVGMVYLVFGLAFAQNVVRNAIHSGGLNYHGFWPEFITAILGIGFGLYGLIAKSTR